MKNLIFLLLAFYACSPRPNTYQFDLNPDISHIEFGSGQGTSVEDAVIIENAKNTSEGIAAEYKWLSDKYGARGMTWNSIGQETFEQDKRQFDLIKVNRFSPADTINVYFDITHFWGKF